MRVYDKTLSTIGIAPQSTLRVTKFLPEKYVLNIINILEILYVPEKFTKFPNFT